MKKFLLQKMLILLMLANSCTSAILAQSTKFWNPLTRSEVENTKPKAGFEWKNVNVITISRKTLSNDLSIVPKESAASRSENSNFILDLPSLTGESVQFQLVESALLTPESAAAFPFIKTYRGSEVGNPRNTLHLTVSHLGINAMILRNGETFYIRPYELNGSDEHIIFNKKDEIVPKNANCGTEMGSIKEEIQDAARGTSAVSDCQLRTYRIAVAATGEYVVWAGSQANAAAQIAATINNVKAIYEKDATITFTLVLNNAILFIDPATDPYTGTTTSNATLATNHSTIVTYVGSANFDLGHLFSNDWTGGLASSPSVCSSSIKGNAQSGLGTAFGFASGPTGPVMEATVAHEIAHQFSVSHTMSSVSGQCAGNVTIATAVEPGGGSTLMAYASVCSGNSYQTGSDPYFHTTSLTQLTTYAISQTTCGAISSAANTAPVISTATATYNIPSGTPFLLTVNASDVNGDALTYTFEQTDPITAGTTVNPSSTLTSGPVFRSYPPNAANFRYFPPLANILANTTPTFEVLPTVARALTFRSVVRDNRSGGSCSAEVPFTVNTVGTTPFRVSSQNTATSLTANGSNTFTITWDVAATTASPVSCANVKISFSTDGGTTFTNVLLASTANDGTETIIVPNFPTIVGRVKVEAVGNIFFDINDAYITIVSSGGCLAEAASIAPAAAVTATVGTAGLNLGLAPQYGATITNFSGTITTSDPSATSVGNASGCTSLNSGAFYDSYTFVAGSSANYTFTNSSGSSLAITNLYNGVFVPTSPCNNWMASSAVNSGSGWSASSSITAALLPGITYTLVVTNFGSGSPALPATYTKTPTGGTLYTKTPPPSASFNYAYVIVRTTTNNVVAIQSNSDMSNSTTFPVGDYSVTGLSYQNTTSLASLQATYVANPFNNLQNALIAATFCGDLSNNSVSVYVNCAVLPAVSIANNNGLNIGCAPTSTTLTASSTGAASYLWSTNATTAAITVSGTGGIFQVTTTDASACRSVGNVTVNYSSALPIAAITSSNGLGLGCAAPTTTLTASGGNTYAWSGSTTGSTKVANVINTIYTVTVTAINGCTAKSSVTTYQENALGATVAPTTTISAAVNSPSLDLSLAPVYATPMATPITGTLTTSSPPATGAFVNVTAPSCILFNSTRYQTYSFQVNVGGIYTFDKGFNSLVISLYNGSYNSGSPCTNLINSGSVYDGVGGVNSGTSVSSYLNPNTTYVLLVGTFDSTLPALPFAYSVSVTVPSGGAIYPIPGSINPGASYNYTYVMVRGTTIAAINSSSDLSGISTVGTYNVYGLSYHNSISAATLNSYINGTLSAMQTAISTNTLCANLSTNNVVVEINCSASTYNLPTSNATTPLTEDCTSSGWTGYSNAGKLMFAIEWQPTGSAYNNNAAKTAALVSATLDAANGSASNATDATFTMKRYWNVNLGATALAGPVNIRFFYSATEKTATTSQGTAYATANGLANETPVWFKTVGTAFNPSTGLVAKGVQNAILLTDVNAATAATINGVLYAQFNGVTSFSGGTYAAGVGSATPLPVTLSSFTGNKIGEKVALRWVTESEQNTRNFTLEKSIDGINFSDLTTVLAAKNTNKTAKYEFIDNTPFNGNNYYRLKTNDLDGSSRYDGSIIVVNMERSGLVKIFPNPTTGKMTIQLHSETETDAHLRIFNVLGEAVKDLSLTFSKGENWLPIDVSELPNGTYFLDMGQGEKSFFVVTRR